MNTILVVDDHKLFTEGLVHIFFNFDLNVDVIAANSAEVAFQIASERDDIALVLLDLALPGIGGIRALQIFTEKYPLLPVVILSASENYSDVQAALDEGAMGYISKSEKSLAMVNAVQFVFDGGVYVSPWLVQDRNQPADAVSQSILDRRAVPGPQKHRIDVELTPRQLEIAHLVVDGLANKEIARRLDVTEATIKAHVSAVLKAFDVPNRARIAKAVAGSGLERRGRSRPVPVDS